MIAYGFAALYFLVGILILIFAIARAILLCQYLRRRTEVVLEPLNSQNLPKVTIQIPIYNELYVAERIVRAIAALDYPKEYLQIQILDDSTDETKSILQEIVSYYQSQSFDIQHITREKNIGYKAGALQHGLLTAKGEYIAIFDSDFVPNSDFLQLSLPYFSTKLNVGFVQASWTHLNRNYSLLTDVQAFGLDAHFSIEQHGRFNADWCINFNGTAGIWRKDCILQSGGWQHDTLTEDLDLSYRAQLLGWQGIYCEAIQIPAELPVEMNAIKQQQRRWTLGAVQTCKKLLSTVVKTKAINGTKKWMAVMHLLNPYIYALIWLSGILSVPMLLVKYQHPEWTWYFGTSIGLMLAFILNILFYYIANRKTYPNIFIFTCQFFTFLAVSMGLSHHNFMAMLQGQFGKSTVFVRTPKFNITSIKQSFNKNKYLSKRFAPSTFMELFLAIYYMSALVLAFYIRDFGLAPFHLLMCIGYAIVGGYSVGHATR